MNDTPVPTGQIHSFYSYVSGADPGFLEGGFRSMKRGSFSTLYMIFHKFPHEIEIIWFQRGVQANHPNPL